MVGKKVVCIDDKPHQGIGIGNLKVDTIYTITKMYQAINGVGVTLREVKSESTNGGYLFSRFQLLDEYTEQAMMIEALTKELETQLN
jgi:hypothetical protein